MCSPAPPPPGPPPIGTWAVAQGVRLRVTGDQNPMKDHMWPMHAAAPCCEPLTSFTRCTQRRNQTQTQMIIYFKCFIYLVICIWDRCEHFIVESGKNNLHSLWKPSSELRNTGIFSFPSHMCKQNPPVRFIRSFFSFFFRKTQSSVSSQTSFYWTFGGGGSANRLSGRRSPHDVSCVSRIKSTVSIIRHHSVNHLSK